MKSLLEECKVLLPSAAVVAATTDLVGSVIDMAQDGGYDGILIVAQLGDVTTGSVLELQCQGSASSDGSNSTLEGTTGQFTATSTSADNGLLVLDVSRPANRYMVPTLKRGTANAVVNSLLAILYKSKFGPVTQAAAVIKSAFVNVK